MGSFARAVLNTLLDWIPKTVNQLWGLLDGKDSGSMLAWIGENWKVLAVLICLAGVVIDTAVHLMRWQPYKVWASFFRRLRGEGKEADEVPVGQELPPAPVRAAPPPRTVGQGRAWVYPDGTASSLPPYEPPQVEVIPAQAPPQAAYPGVRASSRAMEPQYVEQYARPAVQPKDERLPYEPPLAQLLAVPTENVARSPRMTEPMQDDPFGTESVRAETLSEAAAKPLNVQEAEEAPIDRRPRRVIQKVADAARRSLTSDDEELNLNYVPPKPAVDKQQAYHAPVYPPAWKGAAGQPVQEENTRWR